MKAFLFTFIMYALLLVVPFLWVYLIVVQTKSFKKFIVESIAELKENKNPKPYFLASFKTVFRLFFIVLTLCVLALHVQCSYYVINSTASNYNQTDGVE